jgi:hypothetical protein
LFFGFPVPARLCLASVPSQVASKYGLSAAGILPGSNKNVNLCLTGFIEICLRFPYNTVIIYKTRKLEIS